MDTAPYKDALLRKRGEILSSGGIRPLQTSMETNTRQGDLADQASGNNEVHIQLKLKQTDAKILQAIEEALVRIEKGTYGLCRDCGEAGCRSAPERDSVDPRVHYLQGKAARVTPAGAAGTAAGVLSRQTRPPLRHQAGARCVGQYGLNNAYQYVIAREEAHLQWIADAIVAAGGSLPEARRSSPASRKPKRATGSAAGGPP